MSTRRLRFGFLAFGLIALGLTLGWSLINLHPYGASQGSYETKLAEAAAQRSHAANLDAFVNFDYRALDTLGEEFIFLTAIVGLSLVFRRLSGEVEEGQPLPMVPGRSAPETDELTRFLTPGFVAALVVFGLYVMIHGQLTPGGGFQAGAIIGGALAMIYLAFGYRGFCHTVNQERTEAIEAAVAAGYVAVGLVALASGAAFLANILPLGKLGSLYSGGTIWVLNDLAGIEVSFGFLTMLAEFLRETQDRGSGEDA